MVVSDNIVRKKKKEIGFKHEHTDENILNNSKEFK